MLNMKKNSAQFFVDLSSCMVSWGLFALKMNSNSQPASTPKTMNMLEGQSIITPYTSNHEWDSENPTKRVLGQGFKKGGAKVKITRRREGWNILAKIPKQAPENYFPSRWNYIYMAKKRWLVWVVRATATVPATLSVNKVLGTSPRNLNLGFKSRER